MIRRRLNTFSTHEVHLFVSLLGGYVDVLFGPLSNQLTLNKKREAWEQLAQDLANNGFPLRTVHTLRKKWDNLMQETKKKHKFRMLHGVGRPISWTSINERVMQIFRSSKYMTSNRIEHKNIIVNGEGNSNFVENQAIKTELSNNFNNGNSASNEECENQSCSLPQMPLLMESTSPSIENQSSNYNSMKDETQSNKFVDQSNVDVIEIDPTDDVQSSNSYSDQQQRLSNSMANETLISTNSHRTMNYHKSPRFRNYSFNPAFHNMIQSNSNRSINSHHNLEYASANQSPQIFSISSGLNNTTTTSLKSSNLSMEEASLRIELMRAQLESEKMRLSMYTTKKALLELQLRKELAST